MRIPNPETSCSSCKSKCDIYFTAREMGLEHEIKPLHVRYEKHEVICRQNSPITLAIKLLEGNAKMFVEGLHGRNIILGILMPENHIGMMSVFGSPVYTYHVSSLTDSLTCQTDIAFVHKLYYGNQSFMMRLNQAFGAAAASIMQKLISLNQKQIRARVAESLLYLSQLYQAPVFRLTITRKEMAELSGMTAENAVRVLSEFRKEGLIEITGKQIHLIKPVILERISLAG